MRKIGFIGLGVMGKSMVRNLLRKGFEVDCYARHRERVLDVIGEGAVFHATIGEAVSGAEAVITMVGGPGDVEEIYFKPDGILESAKPGAYLIDTTSSSPSLARRLFEAARERGLHSLDSPVTGGDVGARDGTLSLLVGGLSEDLEAVRPVLEAVSAKITLMGPAGAGQNTKLANQIMVSGTLAGMCEGLAYAAATGLDLKTVLEAVRDGAAASRSIELYADRIVEGDMQPGGALRYMVKDLNNVKAELRDSGLALGMTEAVLKLYSDMNERGEGGLGVQAMYAYLLEKAGIRQP